MTAAPAPAMPACSSARLGWCLRADPDRGAKRVQVLHGTVGEQPGHVDQAGRRRGHVSPSWSRIASGSAGSSCTDTPGSGFRQRCRQRLGPGLGDVAVTSSSVLSGGVLVTLDHTWRYSCQRWAMVSRHCGRGCTRRAGGGETIVPVEDFDCTSRRRRSRAGGSRRRPGCRGPARRQAVAAVRGSKPNAPLT